jgi:RNase P protein component
VARREEPVKLHGFPKEERVRRTEEFTDILQRGRRIRGSLLSAFWVPAERTAMRLCATA